MTDNFRNHPTLAEIQQRARALREAAPDGDFTWPQLFEFGAVWVALVSYELRPYEAALKAATAELQEREPWLRARLNGEALTAPALKPRCVVTQ